MKTFTREWTVVAESVFTTLVLRHQVAQVAGHVVVPMLGLHVVPPELGPRRRAQLADSAVAR